VSSNLSDLERLGEIFNDTKHRAASRGLSARADLVRSNEATQRFNNNNAADRVVAVLTSNTNTTHSAFTDADSQYLNISKHGLSASAGRYGLGFAFNVF